jgi:Co/Zn/Cd efflux system component
LIVDTSTVLLDREMDHPVVAEIREAVESGPHAGDIRITDLHVWRVGRRAYSCAISVVTHDRGLTPSALRSRLAVHREIVHATIEIQLCPDAHVGDSGRG